MFPDIKELTIYDWLFMNKPRQMRDSFFLEVVSH